MKKIFQTKLILIGLFALSAFTEAVASNSGSDPTLTNPDGGSSSGSYEGVSGQIYDGGSGGQTVNVPSSQGSASSGSLGSLVYFGSGNVTLTPVNQPQGAVPVKKATNQNEKKKCEHSACICEYLATNWTLRYAKIRCNEAQNTKETLNQAEAQQRAPSAPVQDSQSQCLKAQPVQGTKHLYMQKCL